MINELKGIARFELLSENSDGVLVSGFSTVLSSQNTYGAAAGANNGVCIPVSNNCLGGNCAAGCGKT